MHIFVLQRFLKFALLPCHTWIITSLVKTWLSVLFGHLKHDLSGSWIYSTSAASYNYLPLHQYNGMSRIRTAVKDVLSLKPTLGGPGDLVSVRARARNSRVQENNKLFCFQSYEITCNYANIKFLIWPYELEKDPVASRKFSWSHPLEKSFLYFPLSLCRIISCKSGFWMKSLSVHYREKHRSVPIP